MFVRTRLWGVWWQIKQAHYTLRTLYKIKDLRRTMNRVVINYQEYRLFCSCHKSLEKCSKNRAVHIVFRGHDSDEAAPTNGRNQINFVSGSGGGNNRYLSPWSPGCAGVIVGPNRRLIAKVNLCLLLTSKLFNPGKSFPIHSTTRS